MKRKNAPELVRRGKAAKTRANDGCKKKVGTKGKKNLKADPDFEEEELPDSENEASYESASGGGGSSGESVSGDGGSQSDDCEEDESDEVQEGEPKKEGWEDLLVKLLQDKIGSGKQKGGSSVNNKGKQKVKKSKGEVVMEKGLVVKTQSKNTQKAPNLNGVKAFGSVVRLFDPSRQKVVTEMGFGGLLSIPLTYLPRKFCYWLLTRVMGDGSITFRDEYVLPLSVVQIQCVLGIPMGSKAVPRRIPEDDLEKQAEWSRIRGLYAKGESISLANALGALIRKDAEGNVVPLSDADKGNFKVAFLVVALGYLLCATTNTTNLAVKLYPALLVYEKTEEYDWCTFVYIWLRSAARNFQRKFVREGFVAGSGGCILFVLIFYLDHLSRVPLSWGMRPRLKAWCQDKVNEAVADDRKESGDYGRLPSLDIAYGEKHPLDPRDVPSDGSVVKQISEQVIDTITPKLMSTIDIKVDELFQKLHGILSKCVDTAKSARKSSLPKEVVRQVISGENGNGMVAEVVQPTIKEGEVAVEVVENSLNEKALQAQDALGVESKGPQACDDTVSGEEDLDVVVGNILIHPNFVEDGGEVKGFGVEAKGGLVEGDIDQGAGLEFHSCSEAEVEEENNGNMEPGPQIVMGLVGTRGTTVLVDAECSLASYSSSDEEDGCTGKREGTAEKRVVKPTQAALSAMFTNVSNTRRHTSLEARLLRFVKQWKELKDPVRHGTVLIKCDNQEAKQRDCYEVVHHKSRVSSDYVRMASVLYTKQWGTRDFVNRSKRILLDPSFANRLLLNEGKEEHIAHKYGKVLLSYNLSQIRTVFIPVLEVPEDSPEESHWWCLALDLKAKKLWIIDSMYPDPFSTHAKVIDLLVSGVDVLFQLSDPQWKIGQLTSWARCTVEILEPRDNSYCGVLMLACIKFFARRFTTRFSVGKIPNARANLFLDDVQCEMNELKDDLGDLIPSYRMTTRKQ